MDKRWGTSRKNAWIVFMAIIVTVVGDGEQHVQQKPPFGKLVMDTLTSLKKSHKNSWEKFKAIVHGFQLQFFPPNLDFRGEDKVEKSEGGDGGGGTAMKEAAAKSFEVTKTTAKESAKTAAKVVGETAHKIKDTLSTDEL